MRTTWLFVAVAALTVGIDASPQRRGGTATLAIAAADPSGAPLSNVKVTVTGAAERSARTERGRIAFESLPAGTYRLRFEREDLVTLERELSARGVTQVSVTLNPAPVPAPVPCVEPPPSPALATEPSSVDIPAYLEKNLGGRDAPAIAQLACTTGGTASLMQLRGALEEHTHADADEFLYVVAGSGAATIGGREHPLQAGTLLTVPRTVAHQLATRGRNPLVLLSIKGGEKCK